ncbi:MAG: hypothetical protein KGI70_03310, partial [Patescibacteria group bacterium]|nr:hypothetical protein [Patescibacteria group bacterium]
CTMNSMDLHFGLPPETCTRIVNRCGQPSQDQVAWRFKEVGRTLRVYDRVQLIAWLEKLLHEQYIPRPSIRGDNSPARKRKARLERAIGVSDRYHKAALATEAGRIKQPRPEGLCKDAIAIHEQCRDGWERAVLAIHRNRSLSDPERLAALAQADAALDSLLETVLSAAHKQALEDYKRSLTIWRQTIAEKAWQTRARANALASEKRETAGRKAFEDRQRAKREARRNELAQTSAQKAQD